MTLFSFFFMQKLDGATLIFNALLHNLKYELHLSCKKKNIDYNIGAAENFHA